jgi:hypothetical protein
MTSNAVRLRPVGIVQRLGAPIMNDRRDFVAAIAGDDQRPGDARRPQIVENALDQRPAGDHRQRLRRRHRTQPRAHARRKDDGLHVAEIQENDRSAAPVVASP